MQTIRIHILGWIHAAAAEVFLWRWRRHVRMTDRSWSVRVIDWSYSRMMREAARVASEQVVRAADESIREIKEGEKCE